jgi:hypothetical protein
MGFAIGSRREMPEKGKTCNRRNNNNKKIDALLK